MSKFFNRDRITSLVWIIFSAWVWIEAGTFPTSFLDAVGPALYPRFLAVLIALFAIITFITAKSDVGIGLEEEEASNVRDYRSLGIMLGSIIVYLLIMPIIGFIISTILFLFGLVLYFDKRPLKTRLRIGIPYAILFTVFIYILFAEVLGVLLPTLIL